LFFVFFCTLLYLGLFLSSGLWCGCGLGVFLGGGGGGKKRGLRILAKGSGMRILEKPKS
jgi:hypothetical protein